jgi:hypothetical protein
MHTTRNCKQYSAIADLHTLQFSVTHTHTLVPSVITSRILATDFNSLTLTIAHMKSSFHCQHQRPAQFSATIAHYLVAVSPQLSSLLIAHVGLRNSTDCNVKVKVTL